MFDASANPLAPFRPDHVIAKAAVIGAGSMGSGIAAQFANAGVPVVLLDLPTEGEDRAAVARRGVTTQLKVGGFMRPDVAGLVTVGTTDELSLLADADVIVEAVIENLEIKRDLFKRVEAARKEGSLVTSNTSTLHRRDLVEGLPERFDRDFVVTHFFNPPRHMQLVELVGGPKTPAENVERVARVCERELGKTPVIARDTPGFIANRIGCYWMSIAALAAIEAGLDIEVADAILAGAAAAPKTGVFGLFDLVGLDVVPHVWGSLYPSLPPGDALLDVDPLASPVFQDMLANQRYGRKTKAGFYRMGEDRSSQVWDYKAHAYRPAAKTPKFGPELFDQDTAEGRYARKVVARTVAYAASVAHEIADSPDAIDTAMILGYAWERGPFALAAQIGEDRIATWLAEEGIPTPALLTDRAVGGGAKGAKAQAPAVLETEGARLTDIGDGVALLELRTKMNIFTEAVFAAIEQTIATAPGRFQALVLTGAGTRAYSAGANLAHIQALALASDFAAIGGFVGQGQKTFQSLKRAPFPVVGAGFGLALGGGCESLLHCDAIVAHAELNAGLPESKVGLLPAWGGCTLLLARGLAEGLSLEQAADRAFDAILAGRPSSSALDAASFGVLRPGDRIVMNRSGLLAEAKAAALALAPGYAPPLEATLPAGGAGLKARLLARMEAIPDLAPHDRVVGAKVAHVLAGGEQAGEIAERGMLALELEGLVALAQTPQTQARIAHMLATGKPLRN